MIIVRLMGGLGNQMFQYATAKRIAVLRDTDLKVDTSFLTNKALPHADRMFALNVFDTNISVATKEELGKFESIRENKLKRGVQKILPFLFPYFTIGEPLKNYDERILKAPKNSLLIGYWQTEKYFLPIEEIIKKEFTFKPFSEGMNKYLAEEIRASNSVSLHVRRGDYVHDAVTNQVHGICSPEYYYKAIEVIRQDVNEIKLFIFSDDMEWVKAQMKFDVPVTYIENNIGEMSYADMQLMSLCKHNIIANSSFSWWGAWLNYNPDKKVIAPIRWFNDETINTQDLIPGGWIKL
jgi:Glycosyl transferase family 11